MYPKNDIKASNKSECPASNTTSSDFCEHQVQRRSAREKRQPSYLQNYEVQINQCTITSCFFARVVGEEPASYKEAKDYLEWKAAIQEEIEALNKNQTKELESNLENCKAITCKWVYLLKRISNRTIDRCKARLVAHGFS